MKQLNKKGFTIVELMIATVIFTVVLLAITVAIVQMSRLFYKGLNASRTQEVARSTVDEITRAIQFTPGPIKTSDTVFDVPALDAANKAKVSDGPNGEKAVCIGSRQFSYVRNRQIQKDTSTKRSFIAQDLSGSCDAAANLNTAVGSELLGDKMRLSKLTVKESTDVQYATLNDGFSTVKTFNGLTPRDYTWRVFGSDNTDISGKIAVCSASPTFPIVTYTYKVESSCAGATGSITITILNPPDASGQVTYAIRLTDNEKYQVSVRVVYGDDDLLCTDAVGNCDNNTLLTSAELSAATDLRCKNTRAGNEFCAFSELTTIVERRLR